MSPKSACPQCGRPVRVPRGDPRPKRCSACVKAEEAKYGLEPSRAPWRKRLFGGFAGMLWGALALMMLCGIPLGLMIAGGRALMDRPGHSSSEPPYTPSVYRPPPTYTPEESDDDRVHVRGYTRKDGTEVKAHTRSRPK